MLLYDDKGKFKHYRPDNKRKWIKLSFLITVKFLYVEHSTEKT